MNQILRDISKGTNLDLYILIFLGLTLSILNIFVVLPSKYLLSINVGVLSLIAVNLLVNRFKIQTIITKLNNNNCIDFFEELPFDLHSKIEKTKNIFFVGVSLLNLTESYYDLLEDKMKKGHVVSFLLTDPDGDAYRYYSRRTSSHDSQKFIKSKIEAAINRIINISRQENKGKINLKVTDEILPYGAFGFDTTENAGLLIIELYPYRFSDLKLPKLILSAGTSDWYSFYYRDINNFWAESKTLV